MTLAPRSWPSRPGFAMTTRSLSHRSDSSSVGLTERAHAASSPATSPRLRVVNRHFFVLAPDLAQRVAHLADRGVGAHRVEDRRHHVARWCARRSRSASSARCDRGRRRASAAARSSLASCVSPTSIRRCRGSRSAARPAARTSLTPTIGLLPALDGLLEPVGRSRRFRAAGTRARSPRPCRPSRRSRRSSRARRLPCRWSASRRSTSRRADRRRRSTPLS